MAGYFAAEAADWPEIVEALQAVGKPWSDGMIRTDLRWLDDQVRRGLAKRIPNSKALAQRYRRTEWSVRNLVANEDWWRDAYHGRAEEPTAVVREDSAKIPRKTREDSANADTEERQQSDGFREDSAKIPRRFRDTRVHLHRARTQTPNEPSPNPRPVGAGAVDELSEGAAWVRDRLTAELLDPDAPPDVVSERLDRYDAAPADAVDDVQAWLRGRPSTGLDGRSRRQRPETGIPDGIRRRDIRAGLQAAARAYRELAPLAQGPPRPTGEQSEQEQREHQPPGVLP